MRPCPQCGTQSPEQSGACLTCGLALAPAAGLAATFVGHSPPDQPLPERPPPTTKPLPPTAKPPGLKNTMLGIAPVMPERADAAPAQAPSAGPRRSGDLRSTMLGVAPLAPDAPPTTAPAAPNLLKGTMIGMAPLPEPPTDWAPAPGLGSTIPSIPRGEGGKMKTMLGVARPGIAPLEPGIAKAAAQPEPGWASPSSPLPPPPPPFPFAAEPVDPAVQAGSARHRRVPLVAALAIVGAAGLFTAAGVALLLYRARGAIEAKVALGTAGKEELVLVCARCDDGAIARLGSSRARFQGGRARLALERQLPVGENALKLELERRPGRSESVELSVPVEFRIRGDTTDLDKTPPLLRVRVNALSGTKVVIDGKPVPVAADRSANHAIDVSSALTGPDTSLRTLERRIPYSITPPGGVAHIGEVVVRIGIVPLVVQAPGDSVVIDSTTFVLAGRTAKNAALSLEGRPIMVDAAGQFAQVMGVSSTGETTVTIRAQAPDHAPRLIPIRVRRVESLAAEAARLRPLAATSYAAITEKMDAQRGLAVALDGSIIEARVESFTSVLLLDVKSGCAAPPCLARVVWGVKSALTGGDNVSVYGTLVGSVPGSRAGSEIPVVSAGFVVKGRP